MSKVKVGSDLFENKGKFLFKYLPMPSYAWQKIKEDLILIDFNNAAYDITKGNIEKFVGIKATELYRNQPEIISDLQRCFKEKSNFFKEMKYKFELDDKERYLSVNYGFIPPDVVIVHTNDITEKKKAELELNEMQTKLNESQKTLKKLNEELEQKVLDKTNKLTESEGKYRILFENAQEEQDLTRSLLDNHPDFIYFKDRKARFRHVSKHFYEFFGISRKDIIGKNDFDLFPEELAKITHSEDLQVINTGTPLINKEESTAGTWVLTTKLPWIDKNGNIKGLFGISRDITERKKAEQQLKESEEKYRNITEQAIVGISILHQNEVKYVNKHLADIFGYTIDEIMSWGERGFISVIHPDDRDFVMQQAIKKQSGDPDIIDQYQFRGFKKNGEIIWLEIYSKTINYEGDYADFTMILDITEQKLAESALNIEKQFTEDIINTTSDTIFVFEPESGKAIRWNNAFNDSSGYTNEEISSMKAPDSYYDEDDLVRAAEAINKISEEGEVTVEMLLISKDGRSIPFEYSARSFRTSDGRELLVAYGRDVTERKEAERKLRDSEQKYRTLIENIPQRVFLKNKDSVYISCNNKYAMDLKIEAEEIIGKTDYDFYPKELADKYRVDDKRIISTGKAEEMDEFDLLNGNERNVRTIKTPIRDSSGNITGLIGSFLDITERKKTEEKMQYQAKLVENVSDAIISTDLDFNIITWNKAAEEIYGWNSDEVVGKNVADIVHVNYPYDDEEVVLRQFLEQGFWKGEVIQPRKDGNSIYILTSVSLIKDITGNPIGAVAINRDITERKKSEEKIANLARFPSENPNPVLRVNSEDIIYINQAGQNLFNIKKDNKIPAKLQNYIHIALTENTNKTLELELKGKLYSFDITPIQETGYANIYGRDITERKKAEKQLKESEQKYREAYNRANFYKDLFAHDINNIMQVIHSSAELISYQLDETEKSKNIEMVATIIKKQITRAKKLVQNVIILSDLEESHQPIKLTEVCELLRNSINFMNNSFPEREINFQIESLNKRIFVQANELLQDVFENILTNAVKYNDKITVELEIKISKAHKEGKNYIKIEFRDNGIGVADDRKAIIFEKGHRILKGLKGMGLGLSLVKKILTIYDGKIWVEDRVRGDYNQGSNFILLMPQ